MTRSDSGEPVFPMTLSGAGAFAVLDFGKEVGGLTTVSFGAASGGAAVGLAWRRRAPAASSGGGELRRFHEGLCENSSLR
jgi:hypothetical protein